MMTRYIAEDMRRFFGYSNLMISPKNNINSPTSMINEESTMDKTLNIDPSAVRLPDIRSPSSSLLGKVNI